MANALPALQVQGPDFANAFNQGADAAQGRQMNALRMQGAQEEMGRKQAEFLMQTLGSIGMGALGGDINGTPDPERWSQGMDYLDSLGIGIDTAPYRNNPGLARTLVDSSLSTWDRIKKASDDRDFEQSLREFDFKMMDANRRFGLAAQKVSGAGDGLDDFGLPRGGALSQKVQAFIAQGYDPQTALGLASGRFETRTNPVDGSLSIVDTAERSVTPLDDPRFANDAAPEPPPGQEGRPSLYDVAPEATGVGATVRGALGGTIGQASGPLGEMTNFPDRDSAVNRFDLVKRNLIQSLSLNPRFPVAEQQRIENLMKTGVTTSGNQLQTQVRELDTYLANLERELDRSIRDPRTTVDVRNDDMRSLNAIRETRRQLGVPQEGDDSATGDPELDELLQMYGG